MRLTWKDGLATVLVGAAVVVFAVWAAGGSVLGVSGRGLVVAIFLLLFVTIVAIDRLSDHARARLVKGRNA